MLSICIRCLGIIHEPLLVRLVFVGICRSRPDLSAPNRLETSLDLVTLESTSKISVKPAETIPEINEAFPPIFLGPSGRTSS